MLMIQLSRSVIAVAAFQRTTIPISSLIAEQIQYSFHYMIQSCGLFRTWDWFGKKLFSTDMFISEFRHQTRKSKTKTQHHGCCSILRSSFLSTKGSKYLLRSRCMLYKVINTYIHSRNPNFQISCYNYNKLIRQGKWVTQRHIGLDQPKLWNYYDLIPQ